MTRSWPLGNKQPVYTPLAAGMLARLTAAITANITIPPVTQIAGVTTTLPNILIEFSLLSYLKAISPWRFTVNFRFWKYKVGAS
jgi:hypothetical protein